MGINLGGYAKDFAGDQKVNAIKAKSGSYHLAGLRLQRRTMASGTQGLKIRFSILKALEPANVDAVGSELPVDFWMDLSKPNNAAKLSFLLLACGASPEDLNDFDPTSDKVLIAGLTGKAFAAKVEVKSREWNGKTYTDVELVQVRALSVDGRKKYASAPDWSKLVGKPEDRMDEPYIAEPKAGAGGGGGGGQGGGGARRSEEPTASDPFSGPGDSGGNDGGGDEQGGGGADDDLPF